MASFLFPAVGDDQIRLLKLLPGSGAAPLTGELRTVYLGDHKSNDHDDKSFEALSYVWGSDSKPCSLVTSNGSIGLTESLYRFLTRLRLEYKCRLLWADAICINQDDPKEKERQVPLMSTIFSTSRRVLADLGELTDDTELAIWFMNRYWRTSIWSGGHEKTFGRTLTPEEVAFFLGMSPNELRPKVAGEELSGQVGKQWEAVKRFFAREWFSRLWIVQEFVLARDVIFYCGHHVLDWRHLVAVCIHYGPTATTTPYSCYSFEEMRSGPGLLLFGFSGFLRCIRILKQSSECPTFLESLCTGRLWKQFINLYLVDLLHYFRHCKCSLERDRYFALSQLASDFSIYEHPELAPDYTTDLRELIIRFGRFMIQQPNGEEML